MINGNLEQFLDNGWSHDCSLYYNGFVYYCSGRGYVNDKFEFSVYRFRATTTDNIYYSKYILNGDLVDAEDLLSFKEKDAEIVKKKFLEAKIFDGKSFWEVEKEIMWLEEGTPIYIKSLSDIKKIL